MNQDRKWNLSQILALILFTDLNDGLCGNNVCGTNEWSPLWEHPHFKSSFTTTGLLSCYLEMPRCLAIFWYVNRMKRVWQKLIHRTPWQVHFFLRIDRKLHPWPAFSSLDYLLTEYGKNSHNGTNLFRRQ